MHISEGILSAPVLAAGAAAAAAGTIAGLKKLDTEHIAEAGILAAAFFVASLIHVPIGPSSVHLIMNGIIGLILGWAAFPVILVALLLQAVFFQFGGLTTLGVNTCVMAYPAVIAGMITRPFIFRNDPLARIASFSCGVLAILLSAVIAGAALMATEKGFLNVTLMIMAAHLPVMIIEGIITLFGVAFLKKVQPELLGNFQDRRQTDKGKK